MPHPVPPPATVAVFGGTGRTGIPLLRRLLDAGYAVRALARTPGKVPFARDTLALVEGDFTDAAKVAEAVAGADAVVNLVGHVKGSPPDLLATGLANVAGAMAAQGTTRLVNLTGAGVPHPADAPKFADKLIRGVLNTFFKAMIRDATESAFVLRASDLDYTNVRAPRLLDGDAKGTRRAGMVGEINSSITREDLAEFLVEVLRDGPYVRQEPAVSN